MHELALYQLISDEHGKVFTPKSMWENICTCKTFATNFAEFICRLYT